MLEFSTTSLNIISPILQIQISAYLDNVFDVAALMEDSETKTAALERVAELEDELALVSFHSSMSVFTCLPDYTNKQK